MSTADEEPYSTIFASLKHPIRRRILRMLSKQPMSFMEMVEVLGVSNSFLNYHLDNLGELIGKMEDGKYRLSSFGEAAMATMTKVEDMPTTTPNHLSRTNSKRIIRRSIAIALGLICIVLIALIAYLAVAGISAQNSYNNLRNQNNQLQTWLAGNETLLNQAQTWLDGNETLLNQTQANNTYLQNQVNYFLDTVNLDKSIVWFTNYTVSQPANSCTDMIFATAVAGYVSVNVTSSTTDNTYVETIWSAHGINYDTKITVGTNGTAIFPVLSNTTLPPFPPLGQLSPLKVFDLNTVIRIGNTNTVDNATETVTITYYN